MGRFLSVLRPILTVLWVKQVLIAVRFSEKTNIFLLLTPLLPKIRLTDGQIPPDFLTCPLSTDFPFFSVSLTHVYVFIQTLLEGSSVDMQCLVRLVLKKVKASRPN